MGNWCFNLNLLTGWGSLGTDRKNWELREKGRGLLMAQSACIITTPQLAWIRSFNLSPELTVSFSNQSSSPSNPGPETTLPSYLNPVTTSCFALEREREMGLENGRSRLPPLLLNWPLSYTSAVSISIGSVIKLSSESWRSPENMIGGWTLASRQTRGMERGCCSDVEKPYNVLVSSQLY
jgi:hypothetical protein